MKFTNCTDKRHKSQRQSTFCWLPWEQKIFSFLWSLLLKISSEYFISFHSNNNTIFLLKKIEYDIFYRLQPYLKASVPFGLLQHSQFLQPVLGLIIELSNKVCFYRLANKITTLYSGLDTRRIHSKWKKVHRRSKNALRNENCLVFPESQNRMEFCLEFYLY